MDKKNPFNLNAKALSLSNEITMRVRMNSGQVETPKINWTKTTTLKPPKLTKRPKIFFTY